MNRARASGYELEYLLLIARDLDFLDPSIHEELTAKVVEVRKMLSGLVKRISGVSEALR